MPSFNNLSLFILLGFGLALAACGSSSSGGDGDDEDDDAGDGGDFTVTSSEANDGFDAGGSIPTEFACEDVGGVNNIPKVTWSSSPDGTLSYALVMLDLSTDPETVHAVVCDIETTVTDTQDIPVDTGCGGENYLGSLGYAGPCPDSGTHTYQLTVHALDTSNLDPNSINADTVIDAIEAASLESDSIRGTFTAD